MKTWQILRILLNVRDAADTPIYTFERARPPRWWAAVDDLIADSPRVALVLVGILCYLCTVLTRHVGPLVLLLTLLPFVGVIIISLNIAPIVAQERERGTWELLRLLPFNIDTLLLCRVAGRLWWLRDSMRALFGLLVVIAMFLGCSNTLLNPDAWPNPTICWITALIAALSMVLILMDRIQQFVLVVVTALAAGSSCTSVRAALSVSGAAAFVIWTTEMLIVSLIIGHTEINTYAFIEQMLLASLLGPVASYVATIPSSQSLIYAVMTLSVREIVVYVLWRYTVHAAMDAR
jgi:hypothetical protein